MSFNRLIRENLPKYARAIPFSSHHINFLQLDPFQQNLMDNMVDYKNWFTAQSRMGYSATITIDDKPTVCFGFIPLWQGVAEAWMLVDIDIRTKAVPFLRNTKHIFMGIGTVMGLHRLQIYVHEQNYSAIKYAEYAKFKREGLLMHYSPIKENYYCYGRIY